VAAYDYDQRWIGQTIRQGHHVEHRAKPRPVKRHTPKPKPAPKVVKDEHPEARVYGVTIRMVQIDKRDCHGGCCPAVENISRDHSSQDRAWNDAQLGWMKAVAVRYGSMYADIQNSDWSGLVKQCFRSSFGESWLDRNLEAAAKNTGISDGHKWTCRIIARPCIQPVDGAIDTKLKGDSR